MKASKTAKPIAARRSGKKEPKYQAQETNYGDSGIPQPEPYIDLERAYEMHVWVYRCVNIIASSASGVEILPYVQQKDGSWKVNTKHEFYPLLSRPNPYMSGNGLRRYTYAAMALTGNAYWYCETFGTSQIKEIWPLMPSQVRAVGTRDKMIDHYILTVGGTEVRLPYEYMIHIRDLNPQSFVYGQGALSAAKNAVATDIFAQVWNKSFFAHSARPDATLETDQVLQDPVSKRVKRAWNEIYGGPGSHGKVALLEGGLKYKIVTESAKDMDFVNLRKDLRIEILAAFGVPPSVVGLLEYANYSNMEAQEKMFWDHTLVPAIKSVADTLTLRAEQISFVTANVFQEDLSKVQALQADQAELADTTTKYVNAGIPINEVIDALDLPFEHVEGGDVPRQPQNNLLNSPPVPEPQPAKGAQPATKSAESGDAEAARQLRRATRWKSRDGKVRDWEARMKSAMEAFFAGQRRRVMASFEAHAAQVVNGFKTASESLERFRKAVRDDSVRIIFDVEKENQLMASASKRSIAGTYFEFLVSEAKRRVPSFDFDLHDSYAEHWLAGKVARLARDANATTLESITQEVADAVGEAVSAGFSESETIAQVADRIRGVYNFADETRAVRIARTEIVGASNAGSFEGMKRTGVDRKEWLSSKDERVRETHQDLDGQTVGINEDFVSSSGARLAFPGDPDGPPEEIIQCRCTPIAAGDDK